MSEPVDLLDLLDLPERSDMNEALREWATDAATPPTDPDHVGTAADSACALCGKATRETCLRCERPTCSSHRGIMTGLCDHCLDVPPEPAPRSSESTGPFDDEVPADHPEVGIDWVE